MANGSSPHAAPRPLRPLWQLPIFLIGVAALAAVLVTRAAGIDPARQIERDLASARKMLSRSNGEGVGEGDAVAAAKLAQHVLEIDPDGPHVAEANYLLGTAQMRQADRASGSAAHDLYLSARLSLEEAERIGLPEQEMGRLRYRLGKVGFHTGDDPRRVAEKLAANAEAAEDRAEAYDLLAQAYLRLTPPDHQHALEATTRLRELSLLRDDLLATVKLRSGELKLTLGRGEEARKDLELIGPSAPVAVLSKARLLRARSYQEENKYAEAAALWQAALADKREPLDDRATALYFLGVCQRRLDQGEEALKTWTECSKSGDGPAAKAACVQLAETKIERHDFKAVHELMQSVVATMSAPSGWSNPHVDRARVAEVFEKAIRASRAAKEYDIAIRLATSYDKVAPPGRSATLRAESAAEWGRQRLTNKGSEQEARDLLRQAGAAYSEAAKMTEGTARDESTWLAANCYLEGQDLPQAIPTFERYLQTKRSPERLGQGWYLLGEARRQAKEQQSAEEAYQNCIAYLSPFACKAQYQLAELNRAAGKIDRAVDIHQKNLSDLGDSPDPEIRAKTLFALGELCFVKPKPDYRAAVLRLEEAVSQFPDHAESTRARYHLAESYRQLAIHAKSDEVGNEARNPDYREHQRQEHLKWLKKASVEFDELTALLVKPEIAARFTHEQYVDIPGIAASCRFDLGQYKEALAAYETLSQQRAGTREEMVALMGMARCHSAMKNYERMKELFAVIRQKLPAQDTEFRPLVEKWLEEADRPLTTP